MPRRYSAALFYFLFFSTGIGVMLLSVLIPYLHLNLTDAQIGRLLATQFTGQLLGALFVARRIEHSLLAGLVLVCLSAILLASEHRIIVPVLFFYGLGMGITMTATNIAMGMESRPEDRVARLELLNVFWPLGAISAPLIVRVLKAYGASLYSLIAFLMLAACIWFFIRGVHLSQIAEAEKETTSVNLRQLVHFCLLSFCAVGIDTSISNWMPVTGRRFFPDTETITLAPALFWSGILIGRALTSRIAHRVHWRSIVVWSSLVCALAIVGASLSTSALLFLVATFVAALFVAPLYPAVLAQSVTLRGKNLIFFFAGIGSALVPWLVGVLSTSVESLRIGIALPAVLAFGLLLLGAPWIGKGRERI